MGREILQGLKETKADEVSGFQIGLYEEFFQKLKNAACLIEASLKIETLGLSVRRVTPPLLPLRGRWP
jgi:hypothetical protein